MLFLPAPVRMGPPFRLDFAFLPAPVRMGPPFRLDFAFFTYPCPNGSSIQTRFCFFYLSLSEWDLLSDAIMLFLPVPVRMGPPFRLDFAFFTCPCPNGSSFQTRFCFFYLSLSEWDLHSDSIMLFVPTPVRMGPPFRLDYAFYLPLSEYINHNKKRAPKDPGSHSISL
jgi:hypothetical protein